MSTTAHMTKTATGYTYTVEKCGPDQHWCDNCDLSYSNPQPFDESLMLCARCTRELDRMLSA